MTDSHLYFSRISVKGYRGRNFTLKMQPRGKNSIFIMKGNTGKTTAIELLRWCFNYPQSRAIGKFRHMFAEPAHVLDWNFSNKKQSCKIEIQFSKNGHDYKFTRITEGVYSPKEVGGKEMGDKISKIEDVIEVDRGAKVYPDDAAHKVLAELGITASADYFIFDGERAREYMQYASDRRKVHELVDAVEKRVTPSFLVGYNQNLTELEERIYDELGSKASDRGLTKQVNQLRELEVQIKLAMIDKSHLEDQIGATKRAAQLLDYTINELNTKISSAKSENLTQRLGINNEIKTIKNSINDERSSLYANFLKLISHVSDKEIINKIKTKIRERGKLPEPYRQELIKLCLESHPPSCHICGRKLDTESKKRIKSLGEQVASHPVQVFLCSDASYETSPLDPYKKHAQIEEYLKELDSREKELGRIQLSDKEENLTNERDTKVGLRLQHANELGTLKTDLDTTIIEIKELEAQRADVMAKSKLLEEHRIVLDEIGKAQKVIENTKEEIKKDTIAVISKAISKSVKSILGPSFSARLTEDNLSLGEKEVYHPEVGGMSGRLVLSYCFAESMTRVDPMIIDTPVGNIDDVQRKQLAEHLKANHKQVIVLCLPTEINLFAPILSPKTTEIQNKEEMQHG